MSQVPAISDAYGAIEPLGPAEKAELIDALYECLTLPAACKQTGYALRRVMVAADEDTEFSNMLDTAERHLAALGEEELKRRAIRGVDEPVVANGRVVYVIRDGQRVPLVKTTYSDSLLKTYLEANRRDKFGTKIEIQQTHKGIVALPVISMEMMQLFLAQARGETIDFEIGGDGQKLEIIDGEYEEVHDGPNGSHQSPGTDKSFKSTVSHALGQGEEEAATVAEDGDFDLL